MPTILALDIGTRKTGLALSNNSINVPVSLPTFKGSFHDLIVHLDSLIQQHSITIILVGLPYLPSGSKGKQAHFVEKCIGKLQSTFAHKNVTILSFDERYSSSEHIFDNDAAAAISLLTTFLQRNNIA